MDITWLYIQVFIYGHYVIVRYSEWGQLQNEASANISGTKTYKAEVCQSIPEVSFFFYHSKDVVCSFRQSGNIKTSANPLTV